MPAASSDVIAKNVSRDILLRREEAARAEQELMAAAMEAMGEAKQKRRWRRQEGH